MFQEDDCTLTSAQSPRADHFRQLLPDPRYPRSRKNGPSLSRNSFFKASLAVTPSRYRTSYAELPIIAEEHARDQPSGAGQKMAENGGFEPPSRHRNAWNSSKIPRNYAEVASPVISLNYLDLRILWAKCGHGADPDERGLKALSRPASGTRAR